MMNSIDDIKETKNDVHGVVADVFLNMFEKTQVKMKVTSCATFIRWYLVKSMLCDGTKIETHEYFHVSNENEMYDPFPKQNVLKENEPTRPVRQRSRWFLNEDMFSQLGVDGSTEQPEEKPIEVETSKDEADQGMAFLLPLSNFGLRAPYVFSGLLFLNCVRSLSAITRIYNEEYSWQAGLVYSLWAWMALGSQFFFYRHKCFDAYLNTCKTVHELRCYLGTEAEIQLVNKVTRRLTQLCTAVFIVNVLFSALLSYAPTSTFVNVRKLMAELLIWPVEHDTTLGYFMFAFNLLLIHPCYTAAWLYPVMVFSMNCFVLSKSYEGLASEAGAVLHWQKASGICTKDTIPKIFVKQQRLNELVKQLNSKYIYWTTVNLGLDIPLMVFILWAILNIDFATEGLVMFALVFWLMSGFMHVGAISLSAARVCGISNSLLGFLVEPEVQESLISHPEERQQIMIFSSYCQKLPGFNFIHMLITYELCGAIASLIFGYFLVLVAMPF